jgi:hypothetical protein
MGFLDNLVRSIESGGLEKAVVNAVDGLESKLDKTVEAVDKAAKKLDSPIQSANSESENQQSQESCARKISVTQ